MSLVDLTSKCAGDFILGILDDNGYKYLVVVNKSENVGSIFNHQIYRIKRLKLMALFTHDDDKERKLHKKSLKHYLNQEATSCYYSRTYNLSKTMQANFLKVSDPSRLNFIINKQMVLNIHKMTHANMRLKDNPIIVYWTNNLINGFFSKIVLEQSTMIFDIMLIARRETQNLGTRYNRRGFNEKAFVANYVEIEQIVINRSLSSFEMPRFSSYVQVRGSVPLYWFQKIRFNDPKPSINIIPTAESAHGMRIHFNDLVARYGEEIKVLNLLFLKENYIQEKSEATLGEKYRSYFHSKFGNKLPSFEFISVDLKNIMKVNKENLFSEMNRIYLKTKSSVGTFTITQRYSDNDKKMILMTCQKGVIRTNCVDCLDRTNIAQTAISLLVLEDQINEISYIQNPTDNQSKIKLKISLNFQTEIFKQWGLLGDTISMQYAGSRAHNLKSEDKTKNLVQRYISNVFSDQTKQIYYNLLQNNFSPLNNEFDLSPDLISLSIKAKNMIENTILKVKRSLNYLNRYKRNSFYSIEVGELKKFLRVSEFNIKNYKEEFVNQNFINIRNSNINIKLIEKNEATPKALKPKVPQVHRLIGVNQKNSCLTNPENYYQRKMSNKKNKNFIYDKKFEAFEEFDIDDLSHIQNLDFPIHRESKEAKQKQRYAFLETLNRDLKEETDRDSLDIVDIKTNKALQISYRQNSAILSLGNQLGVSKDILNYYC